SGAGQPGPGATPARIPWRRAGHGEHLPARASPVLGQGRPGTAAAGRRAGARAAHRARAARSQEPRLRAAGSGTDPPAPSLPRRGRAKPAAVSRSGTAVTVDPDEAAVFVVVEVQLALERPPPCLGDAPRQVKVSGHDDELIR